MFGVSVEFYHVFSKFDPKIKVVWTEAGIHVLREPWHLCCHWDAPSFLVTWIFHHVLKDADMDEMWWTWQYDEIWWNMDEIWWYRIWMFQNFRSEFWMSHSPPRPLSALQSWRSSSWSRRTHPCWNDQVFSISGLIAEIWNKMLSTQSQSYCLMFRGFRGTNRMVHFGYRWWFMDVTIVVRFPSNWLMTPDP